VCRSTGGRFLRSAGSQNALPKGQRKRGELKKGKVFRNQIVERTGRSRADWLLVHFGKKKRFGERAGVRGESLGRVRANMERSKVPKSYNRGILRRHSRDRLGFLKAQDGKGRGTGERWRGWNSSSSSPFVTDQDWG